MIKRIILILIGVVVVAIGALVISPYGPLPRGELSGTVITTAVDDWSFAEDESICHFEVNSAEPYSITVGCIVADGELYVGCMSCSEKKWHKFLVADNKARYKITDNVYNVTATRIEDPAEIERVWLARQRDAEVADPMPEDFWLFHLVSR